MKYNEINNKNRRVIQVNDGPATRALLQQVYNKQSSRPTKQQKQQRGSMLLGVSELLASLEEATSEQDYDSFTFSLIGWDDFFSNDHSYHKSDQEHHDRKITATRDVSMLSKASRRLARSKTKRMSLAEGSDNSDKKRTRDVSTSSEESRLLIRSKRERISLLPLAVKQI